MLAKKGRRAAATALALIMTLGTLPSAAFAAPERDHEHNAFNDDGFYYDCSYTEGEDEEVQVCDEAPNVHIHDDSCEVDEETGEYLCDGADNAHEHGADCFETQSSEGTWECTPYPYYTVTFTDEESGRSADARLVPEAPEFSEEVPDFEAPEGMTFDGWRDADGDWADPMELTGDAQLFASWTGGETEKPEADAGPGEAPEAGPSAGSNDLLTSGETLSYTLSGLKLYWESSFGINEDLGGGKIDITFQAKAGEHITIQDLVDQGLSVAPVEYEGWMFLFSHMQGKQVALWYDISYFTLKEKNGRTELYAYYGSKGLEKERKVTSANDVHLVSDWPYSFVDLGSTGVEYAYSVDDQTVVEMTADKLYCFDNQSAYERALQVNPELADSIVKFDKDVGITFFVKASQGYYPVAGNFTSVTGTQKGEIHSLNKATSGAEAEALSQGYSHQFFYHEFKSGWSKGYGIRGFQITAQKDDTRYTVTYHDGETALADLNDGGTWNTPLTIKDYNPGGGKVLRGWSTTDGGEIRYRAGDTYTVMGENLDLYAVLEDAPLPALDVRIELIAPETAKVGEVFTYTLRVCNNGTKTAEDVFITEVIPEGLTIVEVETPAAPQFVLNYGSGGLKWSVGSLAPQSGTPADQLKWTKLTIKVKAPKAGTYTNTIALAGSDKTASATTVVVEEAPPEQTYSAQFFLRLDRTIPMEDGTTKYHSTYYTPHGLMKGRVNQESVTVPDAENLIVDGIEKADLSGLKGNFDAVTAGIVTAPTDETLQKVILDYFQVAQEELDDGTVGVIWYVIKSGKDPCPYHVDGVLYRVKDGEPVAPKEASIQVIHEYYQSVDGAAPEKAGASEPVTVDTLDGAKIITGQEINVDHLEKVTAYGGHDDYAYTGFAPENVTVPTEGTLTITLKYLRGVETYAVGGEKAVTGLTGLPQGYTVTLALTDGETELDNVTLTAGDFTRMDDGSYRASFLFQARVEAGTYTIQETSGSSVGGYNGPAVSYQLDEYVESGTTHTNTNQVTVGEGRESLLTVTNAYTVISGGGPSDDDRDDDRDNDRDNDPTPTRRPVETPAPEVTPPAEGGEVIIPDEEVPLTDLPQEETIIEEPSVPLADTPDEDTGTVILDEGTPLGNLPQTGTTAQPADPTVTLGLLAVSVSLAAAGLWLLRKREDGEA